MSLSQGTYLPHRQRTIEMIGLLGRRDSPTDALCDYCNYLRLALERHGVSMEIAAVDWERQTLVSALASLWGRSKSWKNRRVLMQYTALSWSRRGFPFAALAVLWLLKRRKAQGVVVFHEACGYSGDRAIDRLRRACQVWTMRRAYRMSTRSIFTIPVEQIAWLPEDRSKATSIPIGANIPEIVSHRGEASGSHQSKSVAVFGVTGGEGISREVQDIAHALRYASKRIAGLHLVVIGRNSREAERLLRRALEGTSVMLTAFGVVPAEEIACALSSADVLLFVRGSLAVTRGSAIAGIACGLPIVGYEGPETGFPITEAGLELVPRGDRDALAVALDRVLRDDRLRQDLSQRSLQAHADYFSWEKIADRFAAELRNG